jgi:regulator of replication initiation timing
MGPKKKKHTVDMKRGRIDKIDLHDYKIDDDSVNSDSMNSIDDATEESVSLKDMCAAINTEVKSAVCNALKTLVSELADRFDDVDRNIDEVKNTLLKELQKSNTSLLLENEILKKEIKALNVLMTKKVTETKKAPMMTTTTATVTAALDDALKEQRLRDDKKYNILFFGIDEHVNGNDTDKKEHDVIAVKGIANAINAEMPNVVPTIMRIGKPQPDKKRPILVKFHADDFALRNDLLKKARNLNSLADDDVKKKCYIKADKTKLQLEESKKVWDEWKRRKNAGEDVVMKNGEVVLKLNSQ